MDRHDQSENIGPSRREFVEGCGKYAVVAPPVLTFLLSTTLSSGAIAKSGQGNNGYGNGGDDGVPGNSGKEDNDR
ncbi:MULTISPECIES: hypothetical protein [Rhizobium]|uniref:Uncharacterized protein n=1 Tax=Rhizobium tropici TaxID=398 RepID=A0A6P1CJY1_RHITR|nr:MULTISPECIES: hypothetical protein [Rhizobium]MBB4240507.1 hypothetical protein [Rhizobium tropici]MBB5592077.1 hypothetical protein [Rhizobium tropici]MBB6491132.1 hypothetical protein [Rhizobium tropici]NEV15034.1 hypothetical protein [Rhizobium tropici]TGF00884.1 hypothetical protein C9417_00490 [Rhizobium sp. SEMIA 4088]